MQRDYGYYNLSDSGPFTNKTMSQCSRSFNLVPQIPQQKEKYPLTAFIMSAAVVMSIVVYSVIAITENYTTVVTSTEIDVQQNPETFVVVCTCSSGCAITISGTCSQVKLTESFNNTTLGSSYIVTNGILFKQGEVATVILCAGYDSMTIGAISIIDSKSPTPQQAGYIGMCNDVPNSTYANIEFGSVSATAPVATVRHANASVEFPLYVGDPSLQQQFTVKRRYLIDGSVDVSVIPSQNTQISTTYCNLYNVYLFNVMNPVQFYTRVCTGVNLSTLTVTYHDTRKLSVATLLAAIGGIVGGIFKASSMAMTGVRKLYIHSACSGPSVDATEAVDMEVA